MVVSPSEIQPQKFLSLILSAVTFFVSILMIKVAVSGSEGAWKLFEHQMLMSSAFGLALASASLWMAAKSLRKVSLALGIAILLCVVGTFFRCQSLFCVGDDFFWGPLSPLAAACLSILGLASIGSFVGPASGFNRLVRMALWVNVAITTVSLVADIFRAPGLLKIGSFTPILPLTGFVLFLVTIGYLVLDHSDSSLVKTFSSSSLGSYWAKRLVMPAIVMPIATALVGIWAFENGYLEVREAATVVVWFIVLNFFIFIWKSGTEINRIDRQRLTAFEKAERAAKTLKTTTDTIPAYISYLDQNMTLHFVNKYHSEFLKLPVSEIVGRDIRDVWKDSWRAGYQQYFNRGLAGERVIFDVELDYGDEIRTLKTELLPERDNDGTVTGMYCVSFDITDSIKAIQARDEFLSVASHELRTPLTSLKLQSELREMQLEKDGVLFSDSSKLQSMVASDIRQIERLTRLIDDMLDMTRIGTGQLHVRQTEGDYLELVIQVVNRHKPQFKKGQLYLSTGQGSKILGQFDANRVEQILSNLLSNALKYGGTGPVHVSLQEIRGHVRLSVKDCGSGIAPESQVRIFEKFERSTPFNEVSGLGLGLYIVKQLVAAHNGTISLKSDIGQGSEFIVEIPLAPQEYHA